MPRVLVAFALTLSLSATATPQQQAEPLHVLAFSSEPFFYQKDGAPAGIELEILQYFAKSREMTLEIEWVSSFPELLERIAAGEGDIASGTITITDERRQTMDFSAPYFPVQVVLVERKGESSQRLGDLIGSEVGAFARTTAETALNEAGAHVVQREGMEGMLEAVAAGDIQAAAGDSSAIIPVLDDYPTLEISLTFGEDQDFGFALPKGSPLTEPLSEHVLRLKESGIYFRLMTEYMGTSAGDIVRAARTR